MSNKSTDFLPYKMNYFQNLKQNIANLNFEND